MAMFVNTDAPDSNVKPQEMSLDEFVNDAGSKEIGDLFAGLRTATYSACHKVMPGPHAMTVIGEEIAPQGL